jgi:hypothetical protein
MAMITDFMCPKCRGYLSVGERVIFKISKKGWDGGLLLLSPKLGDYTYSHHHSFKIDEGEQFDFHCPICNYDLSVEGVDNFAKVILKEDQDEYFVVFSKIKGELCTFKLSERKVEESFGEHFAKHIDLLSISFFK